MSGNPYPFENRMVPSALQEPPLDSSTSASATGNADADASTTFSLPWAKNPSDRPSKDQNGYVAPLDPRIEKASSESSGRTQRNTSSSESLAEDAHRVPSGDTVGVPLLASTKWNSVFGGGRRVDRMTCGRATFGSAALERSAPIPR